MGQSSQGQLSRPVRRRRGARLESEILQAAYDEVMEVGWADFQIERVAARCGAGKASIYRRWPNRAALVLAALEELREVGEPPEDAGGDLRGMLLGIVDDTAAWMAGPFGEAVRGVICAVGSAESSPVGRQAPARWTEDAFAAAVARGELDEQARTPLLVGLGNALVTQHFLVSGRAPDRTERESFVDLVWLPALKAAGSRT